MLKAILCSFVLLLSTGAIAQIPQLRIAQDARKDFFDPNAKRAPYIDPLAYVNPFIGTGGHGHTFPGPVVPFGMAQVGPDTRYEGWDGCSGYHYSDSLIYGFSHTHLSGTGIPDYSDLLIVPQVGKVQLDYKFNTPKGYGARFSHADETASPGFYKVKLKDPDVDVRLTATKRCGFHEYTFHTVKGKKFLVLDLGYRDKVIGAFAVAENNNEVKGYRVSQSWADKQHFYFDLQTSIPFTKARSQFDEKKNRYVMILEFPADTKMVSVRVGISGTDEAGAAANLKAEIPAWDFDLTMRQAQAAWRTELSAIQAYSPNKEILTNLYTGLYHAYVHPSLWTDVDGRYRDYNNTVQQSETGDLYSVFSLWDTYRGANPLYTILQPQRASQFVESYYQQYKNTGILPVWTLSNNETNCMIGYHAVSVIADAALKNIELQHSKELLDAMIATSNYDHFGIPQYAAQGFVSASDEAESVSKTLEYAYDDWCIAQYAKKIGNDSVAAIYTKRAASWMNLYNPESGFFQPRKGGMWLPNFLPNEVNHHYTEANAWQYSLAAPHHISSLVGLKGSGRRMERFLDSLFLSSSSMSGREQADITGLIGQYAHGNEPSHHMAYLYNYCGAPHKTQEILDRIMREHYRNAPDGLSGNEDCGQMSAWYVMSAMGFYPVSPGSPTYAIGRPMVDRVAIEAGTQPFVIQASNNSPENKYIQSITWKGESYRNLFITQEMITGGGLLVLEMGPKPQLILQLYGLDLNEKVAEDVIATPFFHAKSAVFSDSMTVSIDKLPTETGTIVYTTNGEEPTIASSAFDQGITFYKSATLKARVYRELQGGKIIYGPTVSTDFVHFRQDKTISLETSYANQYAGGNPDALIDGQTGGTDYRANGWQGFEGKDVVAVITLNESKEIGMVTASCLQDTKSWIFFPKAMTVEVSTDGKNFKKVGTAENKHIDDRQEGTVTGRLGFDFAPVMARYVRVTIKNYGLCPSWHLGAGGKTWLFLDEVIVE